MVLSQDKAYLSQVERGERSASHELARRCDAFPGANGELQRQAARPGTGSDSTGTRATPDLWSVGRRAVLAAGTGSLVDLGLKLDGQASSAADPLFSSFRAQFDQLRKLGQSTAPRVLLPLLETQTRTVAGLAADTPSASRAPALLLASRFAEFTGWMAQEAGDSGAALGWTGEAAELARAGGDPTLGSYALVRRALVTLYDGDAAGTVALAHRAQSDELPPRIRGLAAQREAQGHGLVGDERDCLRSLDRARDLLGSDDARNGAEPVIGTTHVSDPAAMTTGWCLYDLGRPKAAAEVLDRECRRLPPNALRTRARYGFSQVFGPRGLRRGRVRVRDRRGASGDDAGRALGNGEQRRPTSRTGTLPLPEQPGRTRSATGVRRGCWPPHTTDTGSTTSTDSTAGFVSTARLARPQAIRIARSRRNLLIPI